MIKTKLILDEEKVFENMSRDLNISLLRLRAKFIYSIWYSEDNLCKILLDFEYIFVPFISHFVENVGDDIIEKLFENYILATVINDISRPYSYYRNIFDDAKSVELRE